jgi:stringent starvation protein B
MKEKRLVVDRMFDNGPIKICVDATREDVQVPPQFKTENSLVLRFGYGLKPAIEDLLVDEEGISGTLAFGNVSFHCVLPWASIYVAQQDNGEKQGIIWPKDTPPEVLPLLLNQKTTDTKTEESKPSRGHLKLVN